ncbi:SOS response-associated peptidase [Salaquimonas pukyongi]|uniref:SOS response-associated peptidase n=1 Tax=Salaquimonas pukyongi TaxID=2712698 RepID=UPI00096BB32F|nr:SOS response-associated peptidase [Salaquimonas pukyongi]
MCGRFSLTAAPDAVAEIFDLDDIEDFPPRYNIAPTQPVLTVFNGPAGRREARLVRWGLVPAWVKDPGDFTLLVNARSETAAEKPSFRNAMRHRRVLVPASGFYEWHRPADKKAPRQAYWIKPADGGIDGTGLVCFAGLMETWTGANGSEIDTGCILTVQSNDQIGNIHHRMPVVIEPKDFSRWLDCASQEPRHVADLLQPAANGFFEAVPISDKVNKVANAGPDIQQPVEPGIGHNSAGSKQVEKADPSGSGGNSQYSLF